MASFTTGNLGANKLRDDAGNVMILGDGASGGLTDGELLIYDDTNKRIDTIPTTSITTSKIAEATSSITCVDADPAVNQPAPGAGRNAFADGHVLINSSTGVLRNIYESSSATTEIVRIVGGELTEFKVKRCAPTIVAPGGTSATTTLWLQGSLATLPNLPNGTTSLFNTTYENRVLFGSFIVAIKATGDTTAYYDKIHWAFTLGADPGGPYPSNIPINGLTFNVTSHGASTTGVVTYTGVTVSGWAYMQITNNTAGNISHCINSSTFRVGPQLA